MAGRWFEELEVGTVVAHATRRTVTETDNVLFTTMTMNPAPLHLDADYAASAHPSDVKTFARRLLELLDQDGAQPKDDQHEPG